MLVTETGSPARGAPPGQAKSKRSTVKFRDDKKRTASRRWAQLSVYRRARAFVDWGFPVLPDGDRDRSNETKCRGQVRWMFVGRKIDCHPDWIPPAKGVRVVLPSWVCVLEIQPRGVDAFATLVRRHRLPADAPVTRTPGGARQVWFAKPHPLAARGPLDMLPDGIELRSGLRDNKTLGGTVEIPIDGRLTLPPRLYEADLPELPDWLRVLADLRIN